MKIAHRGSKVFAPENTIPAFEKAIALGFDYIEIDVRYTKDGIPICIHDERVNRTTNGEGYVKDMTLEEIKKLDAAEGLMADPEKFKGTSVPTFEEALQMMQGKIRLYMDQKEPPNALAVSLLKKYGFYPDNMVVVGGSANQAAFRDLEPNAPVMPGAGFAADIPGILKKIPNPRSFNVNCTNLTKELVDIAHENGVMVFVNTMGWCDQKTVMRKMIGMGPDAIQTDNPILLLKTLKKMRKIAAKKKK